MVLCISDVKTLRYSIIVTILVAIGMNGLAFGQVLPVPIFDIAHLKSDHGSFPIPYRLINASLDYTQVVLSTKALFFEITAGSDGQLTVKLPRSIIDSKNGSQDKPYHVTISNIQSLGGPMWVIPKELNEKDMRILQINFTQDTDEIGIYGTYLPDNYSYIPQKFDPPLKQFSSGITEQNIQCNTDFVLIMKSSDNSPACVLLDTYHVLVQRGWAKESAQIKETESVEMSVTRITNNTGALGVNYDAIRIVSHEVLAKHPLLQSALHGADKQLEKFTRFCETSIMCHTTLPLQFSATYSTKIPMVEAKSIADDPYLYFSAYPSPPSSVKISYVNVDSIMYVIYLSFPQ